MHVYIVYVYSILVFKRHTGLKCLSDMLMEVTKNIIWICIKSWLMLECSFQSAHTSYGLRGILFTIAKLVNTLQRFFHLLLWPDKNGTPRNLSMKVTTLHTYCDTHSNFAHCSRLSFMYTEPGLHDRRPLYSQPVTAVSSKAHQSIRAIPRCKALSLASSSPQWGIKAGTGILKLSEATHMQMCECGCPLARSLI